MRLIAIGLLFLSLTSCRPVDGILTVLEEQVEAFNQGDVDRLVDNVTDDFKWFSLTADTLLVEVSGKENFRASMVGYFESRPPVDSSIDTYAVDGNRISFREVVGHTNADGVRVTSSAMGICEMRDGKISRAWYFVD